MSVWFAQYSQKMRFEDEGRTLVLPDGRRLPFPCDGYVVRFPGKVNTVVSLQGMPFSPEVMGNVASRFLTSGSGKFPSRLVREGPSEGPFVSGTVTGACVCVRGARKVAEAYGMVINMLTLSRGCGECCAIWKRPLLSNTTMATVLGPVDINRLGLDLSDLELLMGRGECAQHTYEPQEFPAIIISTQVGDEDTPYAFRVSVEMYPRGFAHYNGLSTSTKSMFYNLLVILSVMYEQGHVFPDRATRLYLLWRMNLRLEKSKKAKKNSSLPARAQPYPGQEQPQQQIKKKQQQKKKKQRGRSPARKRSKTSSVTFEERDVPEEEDEEVDGFDAQEGEEGFMEVDREEFDGFEGGSEDEEALDMADVERALEDASRQNSCRDAMAWIPEKDRDHAVLAINRQTLLDARDELEARVRQADDSNVVMTASAKQHLRRLLRPVGESRDTLLPLGWGSGMRVGKRKTVSDTREGRKRSVALTGEPQQCQRDWCYEEQEAAVCGDRLFEVRGPRGVCYRVPEVQPVRSPFTRRSQAQVSDEHLQEVYEIVEAERKGRRNPHSDAIQAFARENMGESVRGGPVREQRDEGSEGDEALLMEMAEGW